MRRGTNLQRQYENFVDIFFIRLASLINGVNIVVPIILEQHKEHERIGEAWKRNCPFLPFVIELPYFKALGIIYFS
jgi:hypothetical protein